jgi:hypothetical protein
LHWCRCWRPRCSGRSRPAGRDGQPEPRARTSHSFEDSEQRPIAGCFGWSDRPCGAPCSTGWYDIGGTSLATPQWAGLIAIADQLNGGGLGLLNPVLYEVASDPGKYAADFFDVTVGNNQAFPSVTGYPATIGWDPVTGLGTPDAAHLIPDLVAAAH